MSPLYPGLPPVSAAHSTEEECCAGCAGELVAGDGTERRPGEPELSLQPRWKHRLTVPLLEGLQTERRAFILPAAFENL